MLGAGGWVREALAGAEAGAPVRVAISESLVADVNLNDARSAMRLWIKRIMADLNVVIELAPKVFDTSDEILLRVRSGQLDAVALNIVEYRQVADLLDPSELIVGAGASGPDHYLLLVKRDGPFRQLGNLRGRRLLMLKAPKMCVAPAWLSTILDSEHCGPAEQFFGSVTSDTRASRVVLPVFFGQADACLTSERSFETMCELNPQVGKDLTAIATSPQMVVCFYAFRRNYHGPSRERFLKFHSTMLDSAAGRQLAALFQFNELTVRDASCLASALRTLDAAQRVHLRTDPGSSKR
jgi:phosphonate transport system substrate-binding protein